MCKTLFYISLLVLIISQLSDGTCTYCIANPEASEELVQQKLDFACGQIPDSCALIQPGGPCFVPNNLKATASYVFNDWFTGGSECDFDGAEVRTTEDPSHDNCHFVCASGRLHFG